MHEAAKPVVNEDVPSATSTNAKPAKAAARSSKEAKPKRGGARKRAPARKAAGAKRSRAVRSYPASSFEDALPLAQAIQKFAQGEKVRRLTLLGQMNKNPNSGGTRMMIVNSTRYGLTTGSYAAEWLQLTDDGRIVTSPDTPPADRVRTQFKLAIENIEAFKYLYEQYRGKKLPSQEVMKDALRESKQPIGDLQECIDTFIVNARYLDLLKTIAGAETLLPLDHILDDVQESPRLDIPALAKPIVESGRPAATAKGHWDKICFYIAPIGDEGTEHRKHSDLFLSSLVEPAMKDFGLDVVRADKIGEPGMITGQVIEHIVRARLVIVDLSYHNPSVFYEMALRHACKLPIVQITRKLDRLPFDVNQIRTVVIDTTDIYTLVPKLETFRSEIAAQVRTALSEGDAVTTPISVFFPGFTVTIPKEK